MLYQNPNQSDNKVIRSEAQTLRVRLLESNSVVEQAQSKVNGIKPENYPYTVQVAKTVAVERQVMVKQPKKFQEDTYREADYNRDWTRASGALDLALGMEREYKSKYEQAYTNSENARYVLAGINSKLESAQSKVSSAQSSVYGAQSSLTQTQNAKNNIKEDNYRYVEKRREYVSTKKPFCKGKWKNFWDTKTKPEYYQDKEKAANAEAQAQSYYSKCNNELYQAHAAVNSVKAEQSRASNTLHNAQNVVSQTQSVYYNAIAGVQKAQTILNAVKRSDYKEIKEVVREVEMPQKVMVNQVEMVAEVRHGGSAYDKAKQDAQKELLIAIEKQQAYQQELIELGATQHLEANQEEQQQTQVDAYKQPAELLLIGETEASQALQ
jgi:hypothetical protein